MLTSFGERIVKLFSIDYEAANPIVQVLVGIVHGEGCGCDGSMSLA